MVFMDSMFVCYFACVIGGVLVQIEMLWIVNRHKKEDSMYVSLLRLDSWQPKHGSAILK